MTAIGVGIWWQTGGMPQRDSTGPLLTASEDLPNIPGLSGPAFNESVEQRIRLKQATADEWDTEVLNEQASDQLKHLGELLSENGESRKAKLARLVAPAFRSDALRPSNLTQVFSDAAATVVRQDDFVRVQTKTRHGIDGANELIDELVAPFGESHEIHVKFKVVLIETNAEGFATTLYYHASAEPHGKPFVQQNAVWQCQWNDGRDGAPPLLQSVKVEQFEEVTGPPDGGTMFADCTLAVLGANKSLTEQLLPGLDHWRRRIDAMTGITVHGHEGLAVGDVNGDGLDDVFFCQPGGLPNRLYVQNADGTASDVSAKAGVDQLDHTRSSLILDLDNDTDQDLVVSTDNDLFFYRNDGAARFELATTVAVPYAHSMSSADYDLDGDLDIYVCCYSSPDEKDSAPIPYHDANTGRPNVLLRNEGSNRWVDVTKAVGLDVNNRRFSFASSWEDYDNDGDVDLYVANDFGRNNLYRNDGGHFVDAAADAGVEDISAGMSVSWGDFNVDGLMDLYVSNMFSSAGNRITYQRRFQKSVEGVVRAQFQRHARGNSLFKNMGDGTFADVSVDAGVTMGRWAWSSNFIDFNNDGFDDIFVANGFITNQDTKDL